MKMILILPNELYLENLEAINEKTFTPREIDVIAYIVCELYYLGEGIKYDG